LEIMLKILLLLVDYLANKLQQLQEDFSGKLLHLQLQVVFLGKPQHRQPLEGYLGKLLHLQLQEDFSDKLQHQQHQEVCLDKLQPRQHLAGCLDKLLQHLVACLVKASHLHQMEDYLVRHQFYKLHQTQVLRKEVYLEHLLHQQVKPLVVYSL
jgi:hypothetical protein